MPTLSPAAVRRQIAAGTPGSLYLIVGDDDAAMSNLAGEFTTLVEEELRAFNVERLYASDKAVTGGAIAEAARLLPMMARYRVVVVLRAEKLFKPKRRGKADEVPEDLDEAPGSEAELDRYFQSPEPATVLVFVASDVDRSRRLYKQIAKTATIVECWGLKSGKDARVDLYQVARQAEQLVRQAVSEAGQQIDPAAARLLAQRAGADIATLRGDIERLLLYAAGKPKITVADAREVVSAETSQDTWAVTNAIQQGRTAEALRQLALSLEAGAVPYMVLGQLAHFAREKLGDPGRIAAAIEAVFRTDQELKSSVGDPRVLLERLVVELCLGGG